MNRARAFPFLAAVLLLVTLLGMPACQKQSYGDVCASLELLRETMDRQALVFKYPAASEAAAQAEQEFIAIKASEEEAYHGYKIYRFGSPFYTSVTAYAQVSDMLLSDESSRMEEAGSLHSDYGEITVFQGKGHKDALFLIGMINIENAHYEVRVTADEEMKDNAYIHAIYQDNAYYQQALDELVSIVNGLQSG